MWYVFLVALLIRLVIKQCHLNNASTVYWNSYCISKMSIDFLLNVCMKTKIINDNVSFNWLPLATEVPLQESP